MLILKNIIDNRKCSVEIDYYVPFTITIEDKSINATRYYWSAGNKRSVIEFAIDKQSGILKEITLVAVDKVFLIDKKLEKISKINNGVPVLEIEGDIKNGLCDEPIDFYVYLGSNSITVNIGEEVNCTKMIQLERVYLGFDVTERLVSVSVNDLSEYEYNELKQGMGCDK